MHGLALCLLLGAIGAPRTPYGGALVGYVWSALESEATVERALYEPLYTLDVEGHLVPRLADGPPAVDGNRVTISLRPHLSAHDGTPVTAAGVAAWLTSLARRDARASFIVLPIAGAAERISGRDVALRAMALDETTLLIELAHPHPDYARLLAGAQAGVKLPGGAGAGPFQDSGAAEKGGVVLVPFLQHFVGRPFLDRVELRPLASRFGTTAIAKKDQAALVFGTPDSGRPEPVRALAWPSFAPREVLVLSIGERLAARRPELVTALDAAVNRGRLASRYLDGEATPAFTFLEGKAPPEGPEPPPAGIEARLLVAKEARAGHRFAERVQLDLHRAGVIVTIERRSTEELERARMSGDYELMIDVTLPDAPRTSRPIDRLHGLLSIGASYGRPGFADPELLRRFFAAKEEQREAVLRQIDRALRTSVGLVPLASRTPSIAVREDLMGVAITPSGAIDLADVFLREPSP